ncbi:amino acid adenylation domain-containing protein [Pseudoalteromonas sp. ASV78]|uniref:non-ribosomal peptide synthetase n=1 Tax=Pseudoalteromonas sp. ASV78 TaxID=3397851 RepID=UPI0039FB9BEF
MNFQALVDFFNKNKVTLDVTGEQLKVQASKGVITLEVAKAINEHKPHLIQYVKSVIGQGGIERVTPEQKSQGVPLSFAQQRLWFIDKLTGQNASYHVQGGFKLVGSLNIEALTQAFKSVVERHESLRTTYIERDGEPLQVVNEACDFDINILEGEGGEANICQVLLDEANRPFNLQQDLMLRVMLIRQSNTEHYLLFTMHHIATDGWSVGVMLQELNSLYQAYNNNQNNPLPALDFQYVDFANWQRKSTDEETLTKQQEYWQHTLAGAPEVHSLPLDYPRPPHVSQDGAVYRHSLDEKLSLAIKDLCQAQQCTLFMVLQGSYALLLNRWSNEKDIVMGTPIANRTQAEFFPLIGFFVNTLVLRSKIEGEQSFIEYIQKVKSNTLDAYENQNIPFDTLVENLNPQRSDSYSPIFQLMFSLQNNQVPEFDFDGVTFSPITGDERIAKFDITLNIEDKNGQLACDWEYNPKLFSQDTIKALASAYETLLGHITTSPDSPVLSLPLVSIEERQKLQNEAQLNRVTDISPELSICSAFESIVATTPEAIAIEAEQISLTYKQLNSKANQLANYLTQQGVEPGNLVGVCLTRCPDLIVSILAILKAGGAYLPLDPNYPKDRLTHMLNDSGVKFVLSQQMLKNKLPLNEDIHRCICVDDIQIIMTLLMEPDSDLELAGINGQSMAYISYTSGSTGKPKGVVVNQLGVLRLVLNADYVELNKDAKVMLHSSISFDATAFELWGALLNGGRSVLYPSDYVDLQVINKLIAQGKVNVFWLTAALFEQWATTLDALSVSHQQDWSKLQVLFGGDVASQVMVKKVIDSLPGIRAINGYGPTENTTFTTCYSVLPNFNPEQALPIGKPIKGTELWVLSPELQIMPDGAIGELCIGGVGLADGYLNDTNGMNEQKFIHHPFSVEDNARLYRSGDLVRKLADGQYMFVSRLDNQVKLRGFRIELGEVESCLYAYPEIDEVVVLIREDVPGDKRLVAYVKVSQGSVNKKLESALKQYVGKKLPDFMQPAAFVLVDNFVLSNNGKVDRSHLPVPSYISQESEYVAPQTKIEKKLALLWQDVLQLDTDVSAISNFFNLGGHSLLATKLLAMITQEFEIELPVSTLFNSKTLRQFASEIDSAKALHESNGCNPEIILGTQHTSVGDREEFEL